MTASKHFTVSIDGLPSEEGHVRIDDFTRQLLLFSAAIKHYDLQITGHREPSTYLRIIALSHRSPATVTVEARPYHEDFDSAGAVARGFFSVLYSIDKTSKLTEPVDPTVLESVRDLSRSVGRKIKGLSIEYENNVVMLDSVFEKKVRVLLEPVETFPGSFRGVLEAINIHEDANVFRIYPDIGPTKITCRFPNELRAGAVAAVSHFVEVRGVLKYRAHSRFPHEMDVSELIAFPDEKELPSLHDLRGSAPDATGELLSEDFIRELRNAAD
jgi:hypothetical protein